ncbi:FAD-dependent oxidoreductase [Aminipila terrae]|uniref:FAD-dependent oxidoreductase n=1 Tax=Aminipila terrae TaxID=2697030 RepID=UPI002ED365C0
MKQAVLVKLEQRVDKETGKMLMKEVPKSEKTVPADLVLIAAGFLGCDIEVAKTFGVEANDQLNVRTENQGEYNYMTTRDKIFVAGDMRRGPSLVVWAIREGREVAREVDKYLMGYTNL